MSPRRKTAAPPAPPRERAPGPDGHAQTPGAAPGSLITETSPVALTLARPSSPRSSSAAVTPGSGRPMEPGRMSMAAKLLIMMAPVSVCHQLSWTGSPRTSAPQATTTGLSGSPTLAMKRSADRSCPAASSGPYRISMRSAVGAVYQTVTRCPASSRYQR